MSAYFQATPHKPCPDCGASVPKADLDSHECDPERLVGYKMFQLRDEVAAFDSELISYLESPQGRFAIWDADRQRRQAA